MKADVYVSLKKTVLDPQGETIRGWLYGQPSARISLAVLEGIMYYQFGIRQTFARKVLFLGRRKNAHDGWGDQTGNGLW